MLIEVENLSKVYHVGVERIDALRDVDITIGDNEMVAIMGSSGSGKSTIVGLLFRCSDGARHAPGDAAPSQHTIAS